MYQHFAHARTQQIIQSFTATKQRFEFDSGN